MEVFGEEIEIFEGSQHTEVYQQAEDQQGFFAVLEFYHAQTAEVIGES